MANEIYKSLKGWNRYFIMLLVLLIGQRVYAATTVTLYVGQSQIVSAPNPPQGALYAVTWASHHASVSVSNYGSYGGQVTVDSYFTGSAEIQCDYYWRWYSGSTQHTNHATVYYYVTCKAVNLSVNPSSMTLNLNEGAYINYSLSPNISPTPTVRFFSSNTNVATVNNNGYVYATGAGAATITVENSAGPSATCYVQVTAPLVVNSAYISSPININVDEQKLLSVSTYPDNAPVESKVWRISDGDSFISLSPSGLLTGVSPGTAKIYCIINGNVVSNTAVVNVVELPFTYSSTFPQDGDTDVSPFVEPRVVFSQEIFEGDNYDSIILVNENFTKLDGTTTINGNTLVFTPIKPLAEKTLYTLSIPGGAVKNKRGVGNESDINIKFKTAEYEKITLAASVPSGYVYKNSRVALTASYKDSRIYYTIDGSIPTTSSSLYIEPILISRDMQLKAFAVAEGYKQSDLFEAEYKLSNMEIARRFPVNDEPLFIYKDVMPFIKFHNKVVASNAIENIELKRNGELVGSNVIISDSIIFVVPEDALCIGNTYDVIIPADAVSSVQGESCLDASWTFTTGNTVIEISAGGPEIATALKTDGSLWIWGKCLTDANSEDGSYSYIVKDSSTCFIDDDVQSVSSGYMHHALIKRDGSLWMWGRQYCGEFGNGSTAASAEPIKIMDGVKYVSCGLQNTAIVKLDGTLWMCGRNDLGQIDESQMAKNQFVLISENVRDVFLNWGSLQIVKEDGSIETRIWDDKIDEQRKPYNSNSISLEFTDVQYGWKNAVALDKNGCVWTWDDSINDGVIGVGPEKIIEGRVSSELVGVTAINPEISIKEGEKAVAAVLPNPLIADYASIEWTCDNENVASVNNRGVVTGIALGKTVIKAEIISSSGMRYSEDFTVNVGDNQDSEATLTPHLVLDKPKETFYNIQGQRVQHLQKGIYIVNGKKSVVR